MVAEETSNRRQIARRSLQALATLLIAQTLVQVLFKEPYPAIKMPAFRGKGTTLDNLVIRHRVAYFQFDDGTAIRVSRDELFPDMSQGMATSAFGRLSSPKEPLTDVFHVARDWFIDHVTPGYAWAERHREENAEAMSEQLRRKASDIYQSSPVQGLAIRWEMTKIDATAFLPTDSTCDNEYAISLR